MILINSKHEGPKMPDRRYVSMTVMKWNGKGNMCEEKKSFKLIKIINCVFHLRFWKSFLNHRCAQQHIWWRNVGSDIFTVRHLLILGGCRLIELEEFTCLVGSLHVWYFLIKLISKMLQGSYTHTHSPVNESPNFTYIRLELWSLNIVCSFCSWASLKGYLDKIISIYWKPQADKTKVPLYCSDIYEGECWPFPNAIH